MFEFIVKLYRAVIELWGKLPEPLQAAIIALVVAAWDAVFREYFRDQKGEAHA